MDQVIVVLLGIDDRQPDEVNQGHAEQNFVIRRAPDFANEKTPQYSNDV